MSIFHVHRWGRWEEAQVDKRTRAFPDWTTVTVQTRVCEKCGERQVKDVF